MMGYSPLSCPLPKLGYVWVPEGPIDTTLHNLSIFYGIFDTINRKVDILPFYPVDEVCQRTWLTQSAKQKRVHARINRIEHCWLWKHIIYTYIRSARRVECDSLRLFCTALSVPLLHPHHFCVPSAGLGTHTTIDVPHILSIVYPFHSPFCLSLTETTIESTWISTTTLHDAIRAAFVIVRLGAGSSGSIGFPVATSTP